MGIHKSFLRAAVTMLKSIMCIYSLLPSSLFHRTYIKSVLVQALMLAVGQALVYYIYAAGYFLSTQLIIEERTTYDRAFRSVHYTNYNINTIIKEYLLHCVYNSVFFVQGIFCRSFHSIIHQSS